MAIDWAALTAPFAPDEIKWRVQRKSSKDNSAAFIPYIDARIVQDRLDNVVGIENWKNEYLPGVDGGVMCGISIRIGDEWLTKYDAAENTNIEAVKGGISDAFKRAAVVFGIGRYLYGADEVWVKVNQYGDPLEPEKLVLKFNGKPFYPSANGKSGGAVKPAEKPAQPAKSNVVPMPQPDDDKPPATRAALSPDKLVNMLKTKAANMTDVEITRKDDGVILPIATDDAKALAREMETVMLTKTRQWILAQAFDTDTCKTLNPREAAAIRAWLNADKIAARKDAEGVKALIERQAATPAAEGK